MKRSKPAKADGKPKKPTATDWPAVLKAWRSRRGLTQKQAAELIGVALRTYEDWERGVNKPTLIPTHVAKCFFVE